MDQIKGLGTALITPFDKYGKVDYEALARLLDTQLTGFVDYIVVLGTTGEAATLTEKEREEVRHFIVNYVKQKSQITSSPLHGGIEGGIPLVLGVGGNCTAAVCETLQTIDLSGFAAVLSVCPYYNKPNQEGLYQHFCKVAEASPVPVILYNVPGRTGVNLLPETVMRIYNAYPDKIVGVKEASGNVEQIKHLIDLSASETSGLSAQRSVLCQRSGLLVISGDDGIACEIMEAGGAGLISVASNAFPEDFWHIVHDKDAALQAKYARMVKLLFAEGNPVGIKAVLSQKGIIQNHLRLPLVPASKELEERIQKELA
jgi:4-hydroxy-tetrahydrodipicolinate synthase